MVRGFAVSVTVRVLVLIALASVLFWSGWLVRDIRADREMALKEKDHAVAMQQAERAERDRETRRILLTDKVVSAERSRAVVAQGRHADLRRVADRVREQVDTTAREAGEPAATTSRGETIAGPGMVLAQLYRSVDQEAIELGIALDEARSRGLACERIYDAMRSED